MEAFDLAVALGIVRRRLHMGHAAEADELLEVLGDELRAIVRDDPWGNIGEAFAGTLDDLLDIDLGHGFPDLPVNDVPTAAIEETTKVVEGPGDVEVRDVHVPMLVRLQGLHE